MASTRSKAKATSYTPHEEAIMMAFDLFADDPSVNPVHAKALRLMLDGSIKTRHIADQCGVSDATVRRWRQSATFKSALATVNRSILAETTLQLVLEVGDSIEALVSIRDDKEAPANVRLAAAKAIIDYAHAHVSVSEVSIDNAYIKEHIKNAQS